jgi:hypothetical protein
VRVRAHTAPPVRVRAHGRRVGGGERVGGVQARFNTHLPYANNTGAARARTCRHAPSLSAGRGNVVSATASRPPGPAFARTLADH